MNNYARNNQPDRCYNCHHIELHVVWIMQCAEKASDACNQATSLDDAVLSISPMMVVPIPKHKEMILERHPKAYTLGKTSSIGRTPLPTKPRIMPMLQQNTPNVAHTYPMALPTNVVGMVSRFLSINLLPA